MVDVWLPYGRTDICVRIPTRNYLGTIQPKEKPGVQDVTAEIRRALSEPAGAKKVNEIVHSGSKVVIVVDDATRPAPTSAMLQPLLEELNATGVQDGNITVIFACGTHRPVNSEEAGRLLGDSVLARVRVVSHDCKAEDLVYAGTTNKYGNKVYLNRLFADADVRILTGDVGFHYYAGYGGGRKSVLPGVSGEQTIKCNHAMLLHAEARTGVLDGNPVHEDMAEAARLAKVDFVLNVVTNSKGDVVKAFAGDMEQVFSEAVKAVDEMYRVPLDRKADIVVVSPGGHPADVNLFQAYKGVDSALEVVKRGGVIICVAECPEGHGNQVFYDWMVRFKDLKGVEKEIKHNFVLGGHKAYYLMRALQKARIILVSTLPDYYATSVFGLKTARAVNDALNEAFNIVGKNARVWAMPYGNFTLPEVRVAEEQVVSASG